MKRCSLRLRLLRLVAIPLSIGMAVIGMASFIGARHEAEEIYDAQMTHFAHVLGVLIRHEIEEGDISEKRIHLQAGTFNTQYVKDFAYRVWLGENILLQSENADPFGPLTQASGFTDRAMGKKLWRVFVLRDGDVSVEVAEDYHARRDLTQHVAISILVPFLMVFPLLIITVWYGARFAIAPLDALSRRIQQQRPEALEPIDLPVIPKEVVPLVETINRLMERMNEVIEREKRFTGYAAHELRTPLAALKTQVQVALRAKDMETQKAMFQDVLTGIDRMTHLVEQLLTLMRMQGAMQVMHHLDFSGLVRKACAEFLKAAEAKRQTLEMQIVPGIAISGNEDMLAILLRNLLDNAVRYTPDGGFIEITLEEREERSVFHIANSGANLSAEQQERLFEPFYRANSSETQGAGLGLAIVKWIVMQHNAVLRFTSGGERFTISIEWEKPFE